MEKDKLLIKIFDIADNARPRKMEAEERPHHKRHGEHPRCEKDDVERRGKKDDFRMPPAGRKILASLLVEKRLNQRSLAKYTNITAQGVSDTIKKLERDELIKKESGEAYNENFITLTEKGEMIAKKIDEKTKERAEKIFSCFSCEELKSFEELVDKLFQHNLMDDANN